MGLMAYGFIILPTRPSTQNPTLTSNAHSSTQTPHDYQLTITPTQIHSHPPINQKKTPTYPPTHTHTDLAIQPASEPAGQPASQPASQVTIQPRQLSQ